MCWRRWYNAITHTHNISVSIGIVVLGVRRSHSCISVTSQLQCVARRCCCYGYGCRSRALVHNSHTHNISCVCVQQSLCNHNNNKFNKSDCGALAAPSVCCVWISWQSKELNWNDWNGMRTRNETREIRNKISFVRYNVNQNCDRFLCVINNSSYLLTQDYLLKSHEILWN